MCINGGAFVAKNSYDASRKIRLIGVDGPQDRNSSKKKVGYYGKEAEAYVTDLIDGNYVRLAYDIGRRDRYGLILADVYLDNVFTNAVLVKKGMRRF